MTDAERIAEMLTEPQKQALIDCDPNDVRLRLHEVFAFIRHKMLSDADFRTQLNGTGLAVREVLLRK